MKCPIASACLEHGQEGVVRDQRLSRTWAHSRSSRTTFLCLWRTCSSSYSLGPGNLCLCLCAWLASCYSSRNGNTYCIAMNRPWLHSRFTASCWAGHSPKRRLGWAWRIDCVQGTVRPCHWSAAPKTYLINYIPIYTNSYKLPNWIELSKASSMYLIYLWTYMRHFCIVFWQSA